MPKQHSDPTQPAGEMPAGFLRSIASAQEIELLDAIAEHGSLSAAARSLGISREAARWRRSRLETRAAKRGYAPKHAMTKTVPGGFTADGVSTLYDAAGNVSAQWVKAKANRETMTPDRVREIVSELSEPIRATADPIVPPARSDGDLLSVYPLGDPHIGMLSWALETGEDFDLEIAESLMVDAVDRLVSLAPRSSTALIANLGDFFHADDTSNRTPASGNALDVDSRWRKVMSVGIRTMRRIIQRALEKHKRVVVDNRIGNHDPHSSLWLSAVLNAYYENEPRVKIDMSPAMHTYYRHGKCLIGLTHGHTAKRDKLPLLMATDRADDWGASTHRRWYTGHIHHESVQEYPGCTVESVRTLAAKDAWHAAQGYRSTRAMMLDVWHDRDGLTDRSIVSVGALK